MSALGHSAPPQQQSRNPAWRRGSRTATAKEPGFLRNAWRLTKPYFFSDDKYWARGLLAAVVALNLASVYVNVRLSQWRNDFFNALQELDRDTFFVQILVFAVLSGLYIAFIVYQTYLSQMLQIRWRRWLTRKYLDAWLDQRTYYRLQASDTGTDNPDQRICDDIDRFCRQTLALSVGPAGLLNASVTLVSFLAILWFLSGTLDIPLGSYGTLAVPGYMVWFAIIYAVGGTWMTFKIGRPLVRLNFEQQRFEADFRFSLVRLRENTESIALYGGEQRELGTFIDRFGRVVGNFWSIMKRVKMLGWFTSGYNQVGIIFPFLVAAPAFFAKKMQLGGLMQTGAAFFEVQTSLSFIVKSYIEIAEWQSVVQRLNGFDERVHAIAAAARAPQKIEMQQDGRGLAIAGLEVDLPNGEPLLRGVDLAVAPGEALLIAGPTGTGKSTLLRAVAGIWPFGRGSIRLGSGRVLFLPQRPYLPLGSLRHALLYPQDEKDVPDERLAPVLETVGLKALASQLDTVENWAHRLSLGEQQRLAFARVLLSEPAIVFLDEATSALDEPSEAHLYRLLREASWRPTLVSVGHRSTLRAFHDRFFDLSTKRERGTDLTAAD